MQIIFVKFSFSKNFMTLHIFSCHNTLMKSSVLIWQASFFKWRKKLYEFTQCLFPRMLSYHLSFTFFYCLLFFMNHSLLTCLFENSYWKTYFFNIFKNSTHFSKPSITAGKVSKYGVISGPYFPAFTLNMEVYWIWRFTE